MKKKEKEVLRQKTITQLKAELSLKQKAWFEELLKKTQNKGKDVKRGKKLRKEIAVLKTIIREKLLKGNK